MADPEYSPEFIDALNAWEQQPPITAEFVFDLPPGDKRKADKVGVLMYQAVLMKQDQADLDFSRLRAVTFTMDVHRTGDELEKIVGHDLPQFRNAAARMEVFVLNLGPGQILIVTDELAQASLSPQLATRLVAWELLRIELARSVAIARWQALPADLWTTVDGQAGPSPVDLRWRSLARLVWTEYFCGLHAAVQGMSSSLARDRLRSALEEDPLALSQAAAAFHASGDIAEWVTRAEGCLKGLSEAMAEVIGQLAASQSSLAATDPHLHTLLHTHGVHGLWLQLEAQLTRMGRHPAHWQDARPLQDLISIGQGWLGGHGLHYGDQGLIRIEGRETP